MSRQRRRRCRLNPQVGPPAALPANPPAPARPSRPATARPSSQLPRENHCSLLPPPLLPRAGCASPRSRPERLGPERPPSLRPHPHRRSRRSTRPLPFPALAACRADFLRPDTVPFGPLPARRSPRSRPEPFRNSGCSPFQPGPSLPARSGRRDRPPCGPPAHRRGRLPHPGRGDQRPGGNSSGGRSARPPFLPAPCGPPACPSSLRPALPPPEGMPLSSGGPTACA